LDLNHPIEMRDLLVIGIDASEINLDDRRLRLLNINVTNQQGSPINATPVRPSFSSSASSFQNAGGNDQYFVTWPYELPGDVIPTVSVNTIYTGPPSGAPWRPNTFYPAGSVVTSDYANGHFYTAIKGGLSGDVTEPAFLVDVLPQVKDGDITWVDSGTTLTSGAKAAVWLARHYYCIGDAIFDPYNGHYYTALDANPDPATGACGETAVAVGAKHSGPQPMGPFPISPPEVLPGQRLRVYDGSVLWELRSNLTGAPAWAPGIRYDQGKRFGARENLPAPAFQN
jgi:hypothetical protein